jgi:hypothetical protein
MTISIQSPNVLDNILNLFGKKRAVFISSISAQNYGVYLARRESFLTALLRSKLKPLSDGWVYPDEIQ